MQTYKMTIQAGATWVQPVVGRYFRLMDCPQLVTVRLKMNGVPAYEATGVDSGFYTENVEFNSVEIDSANINTVKIGVSDGRGGYDRVGASISLNGAVQISTDSSVNHVAAVTVGTAAVNVVPATPSRRGLRLYNASANTIYLGNNAVTAANATMRIGPGGYVDETQVPGMSWFAVASAAGSELRVMEIY